MEYREGYQAGYLEGWSDGVYSTKKRVVRGIAKDFKKFSVIEGHVQVPATYLGKLADYYRIQLEEADQS